jgi:membrane-associated protein
METLRHLFHVARHLNEYVDAWAQLFGGWVYVILFAVVFAETGLVVTPFLPGDSLLFAVGAVAAREGSGLNVVLVMAVLVVAAVLGDAVNYSVGFRIGPRVLKSEKSWLFNKKHLERTQRFYERYGGKTIILARFVPIVRTFAPFVAGIGNMTYRRFALFNITGAVAWVTSMTMAGYFLGRMEIVKKHFELVIIGIVILSIVPGIVEYLRERGREKKPEPAAASKS